MEARTIERLLPSDDSSSEVAELKQFFTGSVEKSTVPELELNHVQDVSVPATAASAERRCTVMPQEEQHRSRLKRPARAYARVIRFNRHGDSDAAL
jgi:hypothetical protein